MKQGRVIIDDFTETIKRSLDNTLNFENLSLFENYNFEEEDSKLNSNLNLCLANNYMMAEVIPYLRKTSSLEVISENDRNRFYKNPMKFSYSRYGVIDYWWIILAVNGYFSPSEFFDFVYLRVPTKDEIANIIDKELFTSKPYGVVPQQS
jgi:hypothetical protein